MSYLEDIFKKRMNQYGSDAGERLESQRRAGFESFLRGSPHKVAINYKGEMVEGVLEPFRQDETKMLLHFLCRANQFFTVGDIVDIKDRRYMVYWLDERSNSGYNRYVFLRVSHTFSWTLKNSDEIITTEGYYFGQQNNMLKNDVQSRSRSHTLYMENLKLYSLIIPLEPRLKIGQYLLITTEGITQPFEVTGFDIVSTPKVMYVSTDPVIERDLTPPPIQTTEPDDDFFWITGGKK